MGGGGQCRYRYRYRKSAVDERGRISWCFVEIELAIWMLGFEIPHRLGRRNGSQRVE